MTDRAPDERPLEHAPLGGAGPLIEVHAHFMHAGCGRADWREVNAARLRAGEAIGITSHVASILGSWGFTSPTYFPSPDDARVANDEMLALQQREGERVRSYVVVNPNFPDHAAREIERCVALGAIGVKLAASRRADDPLVDAVADVAEAYGLPILHHVWQWRRRDWPNQEASDGLELGRLAARHPRVAFILAHIGGGGDYAHTFHAVRELPNVFLDLSGSGVDRGMLDDALAAVGASRLLWGSDVTMETGLAKLRALEVIGLSSAERDAIRFGNATRIFPKGSFPALERARPSAPGPRPTVAAGPAAPSAEVTPRSVALDVNTFIGAYPFRHVPHPDPEILVRVLAREGIARAWVGHLPSAFMRDPAHGNAMLYAALAPHREVLVPAPCIRPDWPGWERALAVAVDRGARAVRVYPAQWGMGAGDPSLLRLADACDEAGLAVVLTVKFEDGRQRHWMDSAGDLAAPSIRALARGTRARVVVTAAGRELIEETHWSLTEAERARVTWDISWIWGPPDDHLAKLFRAIGSERFCYGTMWPLRLTQAPAANLALLPDDVRDRPLAVLDG